MIFVFEEGIHITVSGLTRRLQILEVDFVGFLCRSWFELGKSSAHLGFVHGGVLIPSFSLNAFPHTPLTV